MNDVEVAEATKVLVDHVIPATATHLMTMDVSKWKEYFVDAETNIATILHSFGINMRYGKVLTNFLYK